MEKRQNVDSMRFLGFFGLFGFIGFLTTSYDLQSTRSFLLSSL